MSRPNKKQIIEFLTAHSREYEISKLPLGVSPFEIDPPGFITFANQDMRTTSKRSKINALSNIKRAIDCRIQELLYSFGLFRIAKEKNWSFPRKMEALRGAGIIAPKILIKINKTRNRLEHDFIYPSDEDIEDALGVAQLFLDHTTKFLSSGYCLDYNLHMDKRIKYPFSIDHIHLDSINFKLLIRSLHGKNLEVHESITNISYDEILIGILRVILSHISNWHVNYVPKSAKH